MRNKSEQTNIDQVGWPGPWNRKMGNLRLRPKMHYDLHSENIKTRKYQKICRKQRLKNVFPVRLHLHNKWLILDTLTGLI